MPNTLPPVSLSSNHENAPLVEPEDISIVITVFNHEATVVEALESVLMQEMPYTSVIYCLNDASTDKSAEILNDYAERYPDKIKVFTSPQNLGSGKNSILYHQPPVKGKYWCLLDGDDYWTSRDKLAKQITFLDSHPDYTGCSCHTIMKNEMTGEESIIQPDINTWDLSDMISPKHRYLLYVHTSSIIWRNIFLEQGFFLPPSFKKKYAVGDSLLLYTMLAKGGRMQSIPEVMSCYRVTGRGIWTGKSVKEQAKISNRVKIGIFRSVPLKYKFYLCLRTLKRGLYKFLNLLGTRKNT